MQLGFGTWLGFGVLALALVLETKALEEVTHQKV